MAVGEARAVSTRNAATAFGPEIALLIVIGLWSSTFVVSKRAFDEISPLAFIFVRFAVMTVFAFAILSLRGRGANRVPRTIRRTDLPRFALAGLCGYTFYQLGFVLGLDRTSPFSASLLIALVPIFTMVILAVRGEQTPPYGWLGLAIAVAGVAIFLSDKFGAEGTLLGDALSIGAAVSFAFYGLVNRPLVRDYPPETYTAYAVLAGTIPLLIISTPSALDQDWGAVSVRSWLAIGYMVVLPVYAAYMLWNWAIARRGAATASSFSLLVPIFSGILSAIFYDEGFDARKLAGAALVLGGLVAIRRK